MLCYGRSMMKPFMLKAFTKELEDCSWEQKAIAVASHNGDTEHVATAQSLLSQSEWPLMLTPLDVPLIQFGRQVRRPRRWFHTCSGEHAAILRGCRMKGWNRAGYTLQRTKSSTHMEQLRTYLGPVDTASHCQGRVWPAHRLQHRFRIGSDLRRSGQRQGR